jgi:DNA-binding response OmpR family regulator
MDASRRQAPKSGELDGVRDNSGSPRILVVDDAPEVRALICRVLTSQGYWVDAAATLADARTMAPGGYQAVLVDAQLGTDSGADLVHEMIVADPTAADRILVVTGGAAIAVPDGVRILTKPFRGPELLDAVRALGTAKPNGRYGTQGPDNGNGARVAAAPGSADRPIAGDGGDTDSAATQAVPPPLALLEAMRRLRAAERAALLDYLHEAPIQEIAAATLALHMIRGAPPAALTERLDALHERLDEAARSLRRVIDAPFPGGQVPLARALQGRTAWLLTTPLAVHLAVPPSPHGTVLAPAVVDVTELVLFTMAGGHPPSEAAAAINISERSVTIDVSVAWAGGACLPADPGRVRSALAGLAATLGASARPELHGRRWRAVFDLPASP